MAGREDREADHYGKAVRLKGETFERLRAWAEPLGDTVDSTVTKVLDAAEEHGARFPDYEWLVKVLRRYTGGLTEVEVSERMSLPAARQLARHVMGSARPR